MLNQPASSTVALLGHVTHVPVKEGLQSIIKCLKNQDLTFSSRESSHSCILSYKKSASISIFHSFSDECRYKLSNYNKLNVGYQRVILLLHLLCVSIFLHHQEGHISINKCKTGSVIKFLTSCNTLFHFWFWYIERRAQVGNVECR